MVELTVVIFIMLVVAAFAFPNIMRAVYNLRLRVSAGGLTVLMQQARILAEKNNATYSIRHTTLSGTQIAYIDVNNDGIWQTTEPMVQLNGSVTLAGGAPPAPYTLPGDSGSGLPFTNTTTLGFSPRGLPCNYDASTTPATCTTPAANYFVYYLREHPIRQGWAAVVVTRAGRTKVVIWDGATWR